MIYDGVIIISSGYIIYINGYIYIYPESPTSILCHGFYVNPILCPDHADHGPTTLTTLSLHLDLPCVANIG